MKSLGVCTFFGCGANRLQEEPAFAEEPAWEEAIPLELDGLFVEQQPEFNDMTAQHINNRVQWRRNQAADAHTA